VQYQKWKNYSASKAMHQIENCRKRAFGSNNITEMKIWQILGLSFIQKSEK